MSVILNHNYIHKFPLILRYHLHIKGAELGTIIQKCSKVEEWNKYITGSNFCATWEEKVRIKR